MGNAIAIWVLWLAFGIPMVFYADRMAREAGASQRRRTVVVVLTLLAAPLGIGVWLGLAHRPRGLPGRRLGSRP